VLGPGCSVHEAFDHYEHGSPRRRSGTDGGGPPREEDDLVDGVKPPGVRRIDLGFKLVTPRRTFYIKAHDAFHHKAWVAKLRCAINRIFPAAEHP